MLLCEFLAQKIGGMIVFLYFCSQEVILPEKSITNISIMGLLNHLMGNATEVNLNEIQQEFSEILADNEVLESAYCIFRDKWVFTNKRLIMQDVQGLSGAKRDYHSIPYKSITQFSVETAGTFDDDGEMKIWVAGMHEPYKTEFSRKIDVKAIQKALANHIFG